RRELAPIRGRDMDKVVTRIGTVALILWTIIPTAQALDVDWKLYGWASVEPIGPSPGKTQEAGGSACFYGATRVVRRCDDHVRVRTKCLLLQDMDSIDPNTDLGKTIVANSGEKVAQSYIPPIAMVDERIDFDKSVAITAYEETANVSGIEYAAKFFY